MSTCFRARRSPARITQSMFEVTPQLNPYVDRLPDAKQLALAKRYAELFQRLSETSRRD